MRSRHNYRRWQHVRLLMMSTSLNTVPSFASFLQEEFTFLFSIIIWTERCNSPFLWHSSLGALPITLFDLSMTSKYSVFSAFSVVIRFFLSRTFIPSFFASFISSFKTKPHDASAAFTPVGITSFMWSIESSTNMISNVLTFSRLATILIKSLLFFEIVLSSIFSGFTAILLRQRISITWLFLLLVTI